MLPDNEELEGIFGGMGEMLEPSEPSDEIPEDIQNAIKTIYTSFEREDENVRFNLTLESKRATLYWRNIQNAFYDAVARDFRMITPSGDEENVDDQLYPGEFDRTINVYKAHGQSIIAALSASIPRTSFTPDDADNPDDIETAKAYKEIVSLLEDHNKAPFLIVRILYILYNHGTVFAYNYHESDEKYGTVEEPVYGKRKFYEQERFCPECGSTLDGLQSNEPFGGSSIPGQDQALLDPNGALGSGDVQLEGMEEAISPEAITPLEEPVIPDAICPKCGPVASIPGAESEHETLAIVGSKDVAKGREKIEIYSRVNVKVSPYSTRFEDTPYLILETDCHYTKAQELYPDKKEKINGQAGSGDGDDTFGRDVRLTPYFANEPLTNIVTIKRVWLRTFAYNVVFREKGDEFIDELKKRFPNGLCAHFCNDEFMEAYAEDMDDHWSASEDALSDYIYADPLGKDMIPIQDMTNDLDNLTMESIRYGISETFADPEVVDFNTYRQSENKPGQVYPAKARAGQRLGDSFFATKSSTLSKEVDTFRERLDTSGQFILGDYPSVYGGPNSEGSKTLGEYQESRTQALQRLALLWKLANSLWASMMWKSAKSYAGNMLEDEKRVKKNGSGYVNCWIRKASLTGKVGSCEPETSEQLPISWPQKNALLYNLIGMKNPAIDSVVFHPENAGLVASTMGFPDLYIPGDEDRDKELEIIMELMRGQPTPGMPITDPMTGMPVIDPNTLQPAVSPETSSIPPEPTVDNNAVHAEVCSAFLNSLAGRELKRINPLGYQNIVLHKQEHDALIAQMQMAANVDTQEGQEQEEQV